MEKIPKRGPGKRIEVRETTGFLRPTFYDLVESQAELNDPVIVRAPGRVGEGRGRPWKIQHRQQLGPAFTENRRGPGKSAASVIGAQRELGRGG